MKTLLIFMVSRDAFHQFMTKMSSDLLHNENVFLTNLEESEIKDLVFPIDSQVYSFHGVNDMIEVKEHYNIANQSQNVKKIGWWKENNLFFTNHSLLERRNNLNGLQIRAETLADHPRVFEIKE